MRSIVLIGLPGCGKTTVGRKLAERLKLAFLDCDEETERRENRSISDIFAEIGEDGFRVIESRVLSDVLPKGDCVISTGGGVVERAENISEMKKHGTVVYINRSVEDICADIDTSARPLLKSSAERVRELAARRCGLYRECADIEILNSGSIDAAVCAAECEIRRVLGKR